MKTSALFLSLFVLFSLPAAAFAERQLVDRVIAVVNDEAITQSELDFLMRPLYEEYRSQMTGEKLIMAMNDVRRKLLNQLIEDRLVMQEAEAAGIEANPAEVDETFEEFKANFPDEETMRQALGEQGITVSEIRERLTRQVMVRQLHSREIRSKVLVSPAEIEDFFANNPQEFSSEERVRTRSITIKKNDEARHKGLKDEPAKKQIEDIRREILAGASFEKLAKQHSQDTQAANGGLSEWISRGMMIPVIDQVIFKMSLGEISEIIETPMGYHLFRLEEREAGKHKDFSEVREEISNFLYNKKSHERFRDWMQELKRDAYISIR